MQDLNTIPSVGTFGEVASNANTNFSLLKIAVDLLEHSIEHSRGYFTSASALTTAFPSPVVGDWAIVEVSGTPVIYKCSTRGTWSNSGTPWAGGSVDLTEYAQKTELYNSGYYICETAAATAAKTVSASGYLLKAGGNIRIKMSYANTAANATLNIGGTGAKPLYYNDARASASNTWEAEEVVVVYYDGENFIASNAQGGGGKFATGEAVGSVGIDHAPTSDSNNLVKSGGVYNAIRDGLKTSMYEQIPVTWTEGYYINASNNLVGKQGFSAVQNIDVSGYKKVIACVKMQASAAKYVILDENYTVLKAETKTMPQIDLASYPTAKYMSFTNEGYNYSGLIYGIKQEDTSIQDSFADYLEFGTPEENYIRSIGKEIRILPKINTGITITTSNATISQHPSGKSTEFGVVPIGATKIYYTGWSYGSIAGVLFYDKYKNLISAVSGGSDAYVTDEEFPIPSGTVYYRCCSMRSKLSYYFDSMPQVVLGGESGSITTLQETAISLTYGGYIDTSNSIVSTSNCYYAKDIDISEYSGKKLVIMCNASLSASRNILLDEDYNILLSYPGIVESVDLAKYPTAKYLSVSNNLSSGTIKYSGKIFVVIEAEETESELLSKYYEVYGSGLPAYAKMITDMYYIEPKADVTGYYLSTSNRPVERRNGHYTSEYYLVPPTATKIYYTGVSYGSAAGVLFYDKYKNMIKAVTVGSSTTPVTNAEVIIQSGAIYYRLSSMSAACSAYFDNPTIPVGGSSGGNDLSNYLNRKKYVAIGDSFTAPIGTEVIEEGPLAGMSKVYPYIIANRNNMTVLNQGVSGSVLNGYISTSKYNAIPEDVDYITIWYGINDQGHGISIGTVDDQPESVTSETSTSTCGGFNWFFKWLLTNRPFAHVGVIITDYTSQERRAAIISCCKKWGYPYLDLMGDPTIPMLPGGRNSEISVSSEARSLRAAAFNIESGNMHPSNALHEWQSTFIEAFMRRI